LACSQPFSFGEFTLYAGRSAFNIQAAEISNYFSELRADFDGLCYGLYFCEFADYITKENTDSMDILKLLYQSLRALAKKTIPVELIRSIFELKAIAVGGEAPQVFECVKCKKSSYKTDQSGENTFASEMPEGYYFSAECGGILCRACRVYDKNAVPMNTSTLYAMQYIISKEIEKIYTFTVTDEVSNELRHCIKFHLDRYLDHEFKALEMLRKL
jgi:DNA repair protein RecO (recombination protein O)